MFLPRDKTQTGEFPEVLGPTSLPYIVGKQQRKIASNKLEVKVQSPRLSSDFYTHTVALTCPHSHTTCTHTQKKFSQSINVKIVSSIIIQYKNTIFFQYYLF